MIDCYCKVCGLYISIPDEYAGGSGACPRCKTQLRIPKPLAPDAPGYVAGQRYVAQPLASTSPEDQPVIVTAEMGLSRKYKCSGCSQFFESLPDQPYNSAQCPACKKNGVPIGQPVEFPRYSPTKAEEKSETEAKVEEQPAPTEVQDEKPQEKKDDTVDGYLVLQPAEDEDVDVIVEGVAVDENGNEIATAPKQEQPHDVPAPEPHEITPEILPEPQKGEPPAPQPVEKRVSHPLSRSRPQSKPSQALPDIQNVPEGHWTYFIKGKVAGPLDTQKFRDMLSSGELSQSVLVWKPGMDSWQPADSFDELKVEVPSISPGEISFHDDASATAVNILLSRLHFLLWLAVILWAIVILMFLTRKTLEDLGIQAYTTTVTILLSFSLAGLGMGVMLMLKHNRSFIKSGGKAFVEWLAAMVAFACAIAISFSVYTHFDPRPQFENEELYESIARDGFDCLYSGDFNDTLNKINWDALVFNGRNVGEEFKAASSQKQKMLLIAEIMDRLREQINPSPISAPARTQPDTQPAATMPAATQPATQPVIQPATQSPDGVEHIKKNMPIVCNWVVVRQTAGDTVVMGRCRNTKKINLTVRGGMITEISIK